MGACPHNLPVIDDKDPVHIHSGGKPVGIGKAGPRISLSIAFWSSISVRVSTLEVALSRMSSRPLP